MTTIQQLSSMTMLEIMEKMNKMEQVNKRLTESIILYKNDLGEKKEEIRDLTGYLNKMGEEINKKKVGSMDMTIEELEKEIKNAYQDLEDEQNKNEKQENKITLLENKLRGIKRMLGNFK